MAPVLLYVFTGQDEQLEAPVVVPYEPAAQDVQLEAPALLYFPAEQLEQVELLVAPVVAP